MEVLTSSSHASLYPSHRQHHANMTAPGPSPLLHSQGHTASNHSIQSHKSVPSSSRSSNGTDNTATSTLFGSQPHMPPATFTDVQPTKNILNTVADASSSLFQICVALRQRLLGVPGFSDTILEEEEEADEDTDPVTLLWRTFRRGYPLMLLYNALRPTQPLQTPKGVNEDKRAKAATYKFIQACNIDLGIPHDELFIVTDLYGDDTTGFVRVARVVNRVLDVLVHRGLVEDVRPTASDFEQAEKGMKRTMRQHIVGELVSTERTYVQHLELLQAFQHLVLERGIIPGDAVHAIFLNLNNLLDFQRRFLIRVEQINSQPEGVQDWGHLFMMYSTAFGVYEPYISNQKKCEKTVIAEFPKLKETGGSVDLRQMVESPTSLCAFLMKPFQRLTKYPLLLKDLHKKGDLDEDRTANLQTAIESSTAILDRINQAVDRQEKAEAVEELKTRVEDWKGHKVDGFGELLLYGSFTVLKSETLASGKDAERQYHVYLFETILLCCKNIDLNKPKNKLSNKNLVDNRGKPKLQLKGRIFMQNVTDLVSLAKPGSYTCQIFWKGDPGIENFIIRFTTEEALKKWTNQIENERRKYRERVSMRQSDSIRSTGTSATEFSYLQNQPALENPYANQADEEDDEDDMDAGGHWPGQLNVNYSQSRDGSSASIRSRSTTNESTHSQHSIRQQPPRLAHGSLQPQGLSLRTRELPQGAISPNNNHPMDSYFSPVGETPMSSRTSSSSSVYPFPRQAIPQNGYYEEGHGPSRFTAPSMGRPPANGPQNSYGPPGRAPAVPSGRPGYPPGSGMHSSVQMPGPRNRSASSPDIQNVQRAALRNGGQPPVPEMPAGYQNPNRSQNNSPNVPNGLIRGSPQMLRDRQYSAQVDASPTEHGYGGLQRPGMPQYASAKTATPVPSRDQTFSPPLPQSEASSATPAQLRVKVQCPTAGQSLTLVVSTTITYQTLRDRIDAKLQRSTNLSLQDRAGEDSPDRIHVKLKYLDDDDFVSIQSDEDVQTAFETWREQKGDTLGGLGEIELFCQR